MQLIAPRPKPIEAKERVTRGRTSSDVQAPKKAPALADASKTRGDDNVGHHRRMREKDCGVLGLTLAAQTFGNDGQTSRVADPQPPHPPREEPASVDASKRTNNENHRRKRKEKEVAPEAPPQ